MKRPRVVTMKPRHNMRKYKDALVEEGPLTEAETKFVDELDNALGMRPRLWQTRVIQAIMNGQDVLVKSGTSSGKSLCYHALAHTKKKGCQRNATVLVIAPTIALMEDQVKILTEMGIKAVAITGANKTADYRLWQKVDKGEFSIVFACPEALLGPRLHFFTSTARKPNAFMRNLVAVVVDECHLIHQWRDFRKLYMALGRLRKCCKGVPWLCLSATLTAGAESYVHEVCGFQEQTLRFSISIRRDNVNLIVSTITRPEFEHLHDLIPTRLARSFAIPKTLVFVDSVDNAILIARDLRDRLQAIIDRNRDLIGNRRINPDTVVQTYFSPNDDSAKSATLRTIRDGATRICICTDAFGLGVNIPDVTRVIQWGVSPLLSTSSLFQRVGRAARDPQYRGIAVIYVDETIMKGLPLPSECDDISQLFPNNTSAAAEDEEIRDDELRVALPQLKAGQMERLLLAVEETNTSQVRTLLLELYDVTNDIIQANRAAQAAEQRAQHGSSIKNVDPGVLWVIATKGCRWRVLLSIFGDTNVFASEHSSWCCDNCAHRNVLNPAHELHDIALKQSTAYMRDCPTVAVNKSKRSKTSEPAVKNRDVALCSQRAEDLRKALTKWRRVVFAHMGLPQSVLPCIVLSDNIMEHLVKNAARIVTVSRLRKELERAQVSPLRKKTFKIGCSMLTDAYIDSLFLCIDKTLAYTPDPTELVNRDPADNTSKRPTHSRAPPNTISAKRAPLEVRANIGNQDRGKARPPINPPPPPKRTIQQSMVERRDIEAEKHGVKKRKITLTEKAGGDHP